MSPSLTDYYVTRGRRSSPARSRRSFSPSQFFGSDRSFSQSRGDERLGLSRGRSHLSPEEADRTRSRSLNDTFLRHSDSYADELRDGKDQREPARLGPSSKLTRGGIPLYKASGLQPDAAISLYRSNRPSSSVMTPNKETTTTSHSSTTHRKENLTTSSSSERTKKEPESSSPSYERKRRLSPPRSTRNSPSPSGGARKRPYTIRLNNLDHSPTPSTRRTTASHSHAQTQARGTQDRTSPPRRVYVSPPRTTEASRASSRSTSSPSSRSSLNRAQRTSGAAANSQIAHSSKPRGRRSSRTRSSSNEAKSLRISTRSATPVKKVRFVDEGADSDTDSDISLPSPIFIEKRRLEPKKLSNPVTFQTSTGSRSDRRPEAKGYVMRGDPVLRRRRTHSKTGWSRTEIVWPNRHRTQSIRVF